MFDFKETVKSTNNFIKNNNLISKSDKIIIGLSGGPDSVFLLHILSWLKNDYNLELIAATLDHGWRENSHLDVEFCRELSKSLGIKFISKHASKITLTKKISGSKEDLGRQLRRQFFKEVLKEFKANKIALAHHQDDQIETFFVRLLRGAGISGLSSMWPKHDLYIRPLLSTSKKIILKALNDQKIDYVLDFTNFSPAHLRNRIRHILIPTFEEVDSRFKTSCLRVIKNLQETETFLTNYTANKFKNISQTTESGTLIDLKKFRELDKFIQKRIIAYWLYQEKVTFIQTSTFLNEILKFLSSDTGGKHNLHKSWSILKRHQKAHIKKL